MNNAIPPLPERTDLCAKPIEAVVDYLVQHDASLRQQIDHTNQRINSVLEDNERLRRLLLQATGRMFGPRRDAVAPDASNPQPMLGFDLTGCDTDPAFVAGLQERMADAVNDSKATQPSEDQSKAAAKRAWVRRNLPLHLKREIQRYWPEGLTFNGAEAVCGSCNATARPIGEDRCEQLEYIPAQFKVIVHARPKFVCTCCNKVLQAKAPLRPVAQGSIGPALAAHVLTSKFERHMPLNRQSKHYSSLGVDVSTSLLSNWTLKLGLSLAPLLTHIRAHVFAGPKIHADDTRLRVLRNRTDEDTRRMHISNGACTDYLWVYARHDGNAGHPQTRAVWFEYSQGRGSQYPTEHLKDYRGYVQCDAYGGFNETFRSGQRRPVYCWAHFRRKLTDLVKADTAAGIKRLAGSSIAGEALERIRKLYAIEKRIRGLMPDERKRVRCEESIPLLRQFGKWVRKQVDVLARRSALAEIFMYLLKRWRGFIRYARDGWLEMDNNHVENAIRPVAVGRHGWLFAGSERGAHAAAAIYSLIATAKAHGHNVEPYLRVVFERLPGMAEQDIPSLLPWKLTPDAVAGTTTQAQAIPTAA